MYSNISKNISHIGDIIAIPFFLLMIIYFYKIENKTPTEYVLYLFAISGFILDVFYTFLFWNKRS
jgi:hypothetical protein